MRELVLRRCKILLTPKGDEVAVLRDVDVKISDGVIEDVGRDLRVESGCEVLDCSLCIALPGLVNPHVHSFSIPILSKTYRLALEQTYDLALKILSEMSSDVLGACAEYTAIQSILHGVTTIIDMTCADEQVLSVYSRYGVRAHVAHIVDRLIGQRGFENNIRNVLGKYRDNVNLMLGVFRPLRFDLRDLEDVKLLSTELNLKIQYHLAESRKEVYEWRRRYNKFPVELFDGNGLLNGRAQLVGADWMTSHEMMLLAERGTGVVHCPTKTMKYCAGPPLPLEEVARMGVRVSIGTDSFIGSPHLDVMSEAQAEVLLQRESYWACNLDLGRTLSIACVNGYGMLGVRAGRVERGFAADIVIADVTRMHNITSADSVLYTLSQGICPYAVKYVLVGGKIVYSSDEMFNELRGRLERLEKMIEGFSRRCQSEISTYESELS